MTCKTFNSQEILPQGIIFPEQVHGDKIVEIITGKENLTATDGLFSNDKKFLLGVKTADCAPLVFIGANKFGIIHVGWRGLCLQICEKMAEVFSAEPVRIICGPFLPSFEIQRDFCQEAIKRKFGERFFICSGNKIIFDFQAAILSILKTVEFDGRSTYDDLALASWRRDKIKAARNFTIVGDF